MRLTATDRLGVGLDVPRRGFIFSPADGAFEATDAQLVDASGVRVTLRVRDNEAPFVFDVVGVVRFSKTLDQFNNFNELLQSTVKMDNIQGLTTSGATVFSFRDLGLIVPLDDLGAISTSFASFLGGNDVIVGNNFDDNIAAGGGNDVLIGNRGNDRLTGQGGNDTLRGGGNDDLLNGGAGIDTAVFQGRIGDFAFTRGAGGSVIVTDQSSANGNEGSDRIIQVERLQFGDRTVATGDVRGGRQDGGGGSDRLTGTIGPDVIIGRGGNDKLDGGGSRDTIIGGDGADLLRGRDGDDRLFGGAGNDVMTGDDGIDVMRGNDGNDKLFGGDDGDVLIGRNGIDVLRGDAGDDRLFGGDDNDVLIGHGGADRLLGDAGDDRIIGGDDNDVLRGRDGVDKLFGGDGRDVLIGDNGVDVLRGNDGDDRLFGGADNDSLLGGAGDDRLRGNDGNDRLFGGGGTDQIIGGSGNDKLSGGGGNDRLDGGAGNDRLTGNAGVDLFVFGANAGVDTVRDFTPGGDRIDVSAHGFADFAAVQAATQDVNGFAVVTLTGGASVTLVGVLEADLAAADFGLPA